MIRRKFPSIPHLLFSGTISRDDKVGDMPIKWDDCNIVRDKK